MNDLLKTIAPTLASALLGPIGGVAVAAIGKILGIDGATQASITQTIQEGKITPDHLAEIKKLELEYKERERAEGFLYAELEFKDRDSARRMAVDGGIAGRLFVMSVVLITMCLGSEIYILFHGVPDHAPELIIGRVLGLLDAVAMMILSYYYSSTHKLVATSAPPPR